MYLILNMVKERLSLDKKGKWLLKLKWLWFKNINLWYFFKYGSFVFDISFVIFEDSMFNVN